MSLASGAKLGPYEVLAPLGAGGMGEVYRARDTRLDRTVAIKVLPEHLAASADLRQRFEREARTVSSLNHPHICVLHDIGQQDGVDFLVLEYLDGESLHDRLDKGPLPLEQALRYATEIAEALTMAHRSGVVHRDLKPSNVMLTKAGVKLLDFGLAKRAEPVVKGDAQLSGLDTRARPLTEKGTLLGTIPYMSPEQIEGREADARTDLWGLGCLLYEMATGKPAFAGSSAAGLIGAILKDAPKPIRELKPLTPPSLERLVKACLAKDPDERWQSAHDVADELRWIAGEASRPSATVAETSPSAALARWAPWLLAAAGLGSAAFLWVQRSPDARALQVQHFDLGLPRDIEPVPYYDSGIALSPDGRMVALLGVKRGARSVFVRRLESEEPLELEASGAARGAAFSPDSTRIAVLRPNGDITAFSLADRQQTLVATGADPFGSLSWGESGVAFVQRGGLSIARPGSSEARALTVVDAARGEFQHGSPTFLPGGRTLLFASLTTEPGTERIEAVSADGGERRVLLERATTPVWSPSGHLLFARDGALLATEFDAGAVRVRGVATPVFPPGYMLTSFIGASLLRLSSNGTLAYLPRDFAAQRLVSVSREGAASTLDLPFRGYYTPRVSPDGRRVVVATDFRTLEALDLVRGTRTQVTTAGHYTIWHTWSRDGSRLAYRRYASVSWIATDGSDRQGEVKGSSVSDSPSAPGPDSDSVLVVRVTEGNAGDVYLLSLSNAFAPRPLLATRAFEGGAQLSPDGRWLVYVSDDAGQFEVRVRRFPELDRQWQISEGGGTQPRWSASGREIYYRGAANVTAVRFDGSGREPAIGKPMPLFRDDYDLGLGATIANYDVTPDGRFLMLRRDVQSGRVRVVLNWTEELKRALAQSASR
jgi:Tol biopolymer transport system component